MTPNEVKELIRKDDEYVAGALVALYEQQTADEQTFQSTVHKNGLGFNAIDADILTDICKYYLKRKTLSTKQLQLVRLKLYKYTRQLAILGVKPQKVTRAIVRGKNKEKRATLFGDNRVLFNFPFDRELINAIKQINGFYYNPDTKEWSTPLSILALELAKRWEFILDEALVNWLDEKTKGLSADIIVPGLDDVLRPFQKIAVSFIETRNGRVLIADEMGLGKTLETIAWMVYRGEEILPALIIPPASLKINWHKEFEKWTDWGDHVEILSGKTPYEVEQPIAIINYDILYDWMDYLMKDFKPKLVVLDEIHKIKSPGTKMKKDEEGIWRRVLGIQRSYASEKVCKRAKFVIGLTGTPFLNKPKEIYNPIKVIKPSLFPNYKRFGYRYCNPKFNGWATVFDGASNTEELNKILTMEIMLRRRKAEVLSELPPKTFALLPLSIDNEARYRKAQDDFLGYLKSTTPSKIKAAKKAEGLVKINALRRLAVDGKMAQGIDWVQDVLDGGESLVVFAWHTKVINTIAASFPDVSVIVDGKVSMKQRNKRIEQFAEGKKTLFVGQIEAAGQGVDGLQNACSNMAFFEYPWSPGLYAQATDRLHRIGQLLAVTIWNLVAAKTIEEKFIELLETKSKMFDQVIDGVDLEEDPSMFTELVAQMKAA